MSAVIPIFYTVPLYSIVIVASKQKKTITGTYVLFVAIPKAIGNRSDSTT